MSPHAQLAAGSAQSCPPAQSPAASIAQSNGAPVTPNLGPPGLSRWGSDFNPTCVATIKCDEIRFGREVHGARPTYLDQTRCQTREEHPSFDVASDGTETRLVLSYIGKLTGARMARDARAEQITLLRTHEGDAPFVALQVMPEVPWFRRFLSIRDHNPDEDNNEGGRKYIVCMVQPSSSAELKEAVAIICRDAKLALIHRTITEGERAYYLRASSSVRREDERLEQAMCRKQERLESEKRAVLRFRDTLHRREIDLRVEEREVKRLKLQLIYLTPADERTESEFAQLYGEFGVAAAKAAQRWQPAPVPAPEPQLMEAVATSAIGTQTDHHLSLDELERLREENARLTAMVNSMMFASRQPLQPPLPMTHAAPMQMMHAHMPPVPPAAAPRPVPPLPILHRREIDTLSRARLRQYLSSMAGYSTFGTPDELKARVNQYFDVHGIEIYRCGFAGPLPLAADGMARTRYS